MKLNYQNKLSVHICFIGAFYIVFAFFNICLARDPCDKFSNEINNITQKINDLNHQEVAFLKDSINSIESQINELNRQIAKIYDKGCQNLKDRQSLRKFIDFKIDSLVSKAKKSIDSLQISILCDSAKNELADAKISFFNKLSKINRAPDFKNLNRTNLCLSFAYFPQGVSHFIDGNIVKLNYNSIPGVSYQSGPFYSPQTELGIGAWKYFNVAVGLGVIFGKEQFLINSSTDAKKIDTIDRYTTEYYYPFLCISPGFTYRHFPFKINISPEARFLISYYYNYHTSTVLGQQIVNENTSDKGICFFSYGFKIGLEYLFSPHFGIGFNFNARTFWRTEPNLEWYDDYYKILYRRLSPEYVLHPYQLTHEFQLPFYSVLCNISYYF